MNVPPFLVLCLVACTACAVCGARSDLTAARNDLRATLEDVRKAHPEISGTHPVVLDVGGKNGWLDFLKLVKRWQDVLDSEADSEWVGLLEQINESPESLHGEKQIELLSVVLDRSDLIAQGAAQLLKNDYLIGGDPKSEDEGSEVSILQITNLFRLLTSRVTSMVALKRHSKEISEAALLVYQLCMKVECGVHLSGRLTTVGVRSETIDRLLAACRLFSNPVREEWLDQLVRRSPSRLFSPRDWWIGECKSMLDRANLLLKMSDEDLAGMYEEVKESYASIEDLLRGAQSEVRAAVALIETLSKVDAVADPKKSEIVLERLEELKRKLNNDLSTVEFTARTMGSLELVEAADRLTLAVRLHETRQRSMPNADSIRRILTSFPGLRIEQTEVGLVINATADHPLRQSGKHEFFGLPRRLESWTAE